MSGEIFISYSRTDSSFVRQLSTYLHQEEVPPWVDNQLEYGDSWQQLIVERIRRCIVFLIVMSEQSRQSHFVRDEIKLALQEKKTVIPIWIGGEQFVELTGLQFVDARRVGWQDNRFVERLRTLVGGSVPSLTVQRRRVEQFVFLTLREISECQTPIVAFGVGYNADYGIPRDASLNELIDEMGWIELMLCLNEQLPGRNFDLSQDDYKSRRFARVNDLVDHFLKLMAWEDIRRIDVR
jgi:hypothetical protein